MSRSALAERWRLSEQRLIGGFVFYDSLTLRATHDNRDLQTLFAPRTPIVRQKNFGDPSVTSGFTITFRPVHVPFDLGATADLERSRLMQATAIV